MTIARLLPAFLAAAAWAAEPAPKPAAAQPPAYHALDCGALVPVPKGYRAVSRHPELDPGAEIAVLFRRGEPAAALRADAPSDGRILVSVSPLSPAELADPAAFFARLEERLRAEARARPGRVEVRALDGLPRPALFYRVAAPSLTRVYMLAPGRLITISAERWGKAVSDVVKGYRDGPAP